MRWRQSTRLRNKGKKARTQRIANYLRVLDEQNGQPHCSLCLEDQNDNTCGYIYEVILFGEARFWRDEENATGPPPNGYRILVDN
jgi:hypothetical protein